MSQRINLRLICYSIACFAIVAVVVHFLHSWQLQREARIFLVKAQEAEAGGNVGRAIDLYGKYLSVVPKDVDAKAEYGSLLAAVGAYEAAFSAFEAVLRLDESRSDIRRKAVKTAIATNRVSDARDHLENFLLKEFPEDAELLELEGLCLAKSGKSLDAGREFLAAIKQERTRISAYMQLIALLSTPNADLDKDRKGWLEAMPAEKKDALKQDNAWADKMADYWTNQMVAANPKEPKVLVFRGLRRLRRRGEATFKDSGFKAVLDDTEAALKLSPENPDALYLAALSCSAAEQPTRARDYAIRGTQAAPKEPRFYEILAQIDLADKKPDEAIKWLQKGIDVDGPPELWWRLGSVQIAHGKFDEAKETAKGIREKTFPKLNSAASPTSVEPNLYADLLDAQVEQARGHWQDAALQFAQIGEGLHSAPELAKQAFYSLGRSYEQLANPERAVNAYRQAVKADPTWIAAREALAGNLQKLGRLDEALEELTTLTKFNDTPLSAWAALIHLSIAKTSRLSPDQRDWGGTDGLVNQLATLKADSAAVPLLRAELLVAQDHAAEAKKILETARDRNPKEVAIWLALAELAIRDSQWEQASKILKEVEKKLGDSVALRVARAQYLVGKGETGAAESLRKLSENSKEFSKQDQVRLWRALTSASSAIADFSQAAGLCQHVMRELPGDLGVRLELFSLAAQAKDAKLMDDALNEIHRVENDGRLEKRGPIWHFAMALRLVASDQHGRGSDDVKPDAPGTSPGDYAQRQANLKQARDHLDEALKLRAGWSRALSLQGMIYEESHQEEAALAKYLEAVRQGENNPDLARRAIGLLYRKGEYAAANTLIQQLEAQRIPFTTELFREQSQVLGGLQDYPGAVNAAKKVADSSTDYRDFLWLGLLLDIRGQHDEARKAHDEARKAHDEARKAFKRALSLDEHAPESWVAFIQFLARTGQKTDAEKALNDARAQIPAAKRPLALAQCLEVLGKLDEASQQYAAAASQSPDDLTVNRSLVPFYLRTGNFPKAENLLRKVVEGGMNASPALVAGARRDLAVRVLAAHGGYPKLAEAIQLLDQNLAKDPASMDDLRAKAIVLGTSPVRSQRQEAISILEKFKNAAAEDHFRLAQLYLASGDWANARRQFADGMAGQGNQPQYVAAYAQALLDHNELGEAELWIERLEQTAPENTRAVQLRAEMQFRKGKLKESEQLYRDALQMAEKVCEGAETPQIAAVCEMLALQAGLTPSQRDRLAGILVAALKKHERAEPLLLALAELREMQGEFREAVALYREVLQGDQYNVAALNNLAELISLSGGNLDEARDLIEKALTTAGPQPALLDTSATVYLALGQAEKALATMQEVLEQQPTANRHFHLALILQKLGRTEEATKELKKAQDMQIRVESLHPLERSTYLDLLRTLQ